MKNLKKGIFALLVALFVFIPAGVYAHTVTFDTDGGTVIAPQSVDDAEYATRPSDPEKSGFLFYTWLGADGNEFIFESTPIHGDITVYADYIELIDSVDLTVTLPEVGTEIRVVDAMSRPGATVTFPNGAKYNGEAINIVKAVDSDEAFSGTIEPGKEYIVEIWLEAEGGYYFSRNRAIKINGGKDSYTLGQFYRDAEPSGGLLLFAKVKVPEEDENANTPSTGDNVMTYVGLGTLSLISLSAVGLYLKKKKANI